MKEIFHQKAMEIGLKKDTLNWALVMIGRLVDMIIYD